MDYTVYKSKRKTIRLVIRADGTLAVYCPKACTKKYLDEVVKKHYPSLKEKHEARGNALFGDGEPTLPYLGKRYPIIYNNERKFRFAGDSFVSPSRDTEVIRSLYREFLRAETKKIVPPLVRSFAEQFGFEYGKVSIKAIYSRYGSCSSKKNLNFTLVLAAYELDYIKMVVAHELCHTVHFNHSTQFYSLLDKVFPPHKEVKARDKKAKSQILKAVFFN